MPVRSAIATRMMHTRGFALWVCAIAFVGLICFFLTGSHTPVAGDRGFALPSANEWLPAGGLSFACSMAANAAIVITAAAMAKIHNILRSITGLYMALFAVMQLATPQLTVQLYTGPLLALAIAICLLLLFGVYRSERASGRVLLTFMSLSALSATQYCYAVYIPAMLICCAQMRVLEIGRAHV